mgnify:CR=1 FL=1
MALRKASSYSKKPARPYTRKSAVKSKSYIKTVPPQKVVKMKMGDLKGYENGKFKLFVKLSSGENILIRDNALEAARQYVHKVLDESLPGQYYFELKVFPHHIIREHRVATGAGADRMAIGMAHSFGMPIGRGAFVKQNQPVFVVAVSNEKARKIAIDALTKVKAKLPCHCLISVENLD